MTEPKSPDRSQGRRIDAIVIGASAGGVDALARLLPALPADLEVPVFVVQHLPRQRPSLLVEIFAGKSVLPIREAEDKEPAARGTIYFAPPDYHMLIEKGPQIVLSTDEAVNYSRPSIDVLFETASDVFGERLLGIILTGASEDGASGLEAVHVAGGMTVVQSPEQAYCPIMPAAALRRCPQALSLGLEKISRLLGSLPASPPLRSAAIIR